MLKLKYTKRIKKKRYLHSYARARRGQLIWLLVIPFLRLRSKKKMRAWAGLFDLPNSNLQKFSRCIVRLSYERNKHLDVRIWHFHHPSLSFSGENIYTTNSIIASSKGHGHFMPTLFNLLFKLWRLIEKGLRWSLAVRLLSFELFGHLLEQIN